MPARMAGTSVRVTATLISGISMPPMPMLRMNGIGSAISASRPSATVTPLNMIARPAVLMAVRIAVSLSLPWATSSRQRVISSSE